MAYVRVGTRRLAIKKGLAGTPSMAYGTPPMFQTSESYIIANAETASMSGFYGPWWDVTIQPLRSIFNTGGINLWGLASGMSNGEKLYVYNPEIGDLFALFIWKSSDEFYVGTRQGGVDDTTYYRINPFFLTAEDPESVITFPQEALGFLYNETTQHFNFYVISITSNTLQGYYYWQTFDWTQAINNVLTMLFFKNLPSSDPYVPGSTSETGGGEGSFDDASDAVTMPGAPALNLSINGFVTAYAPTLTQINDLATFIWSDWLSGGPTLPKIFANPEDAIISLHMLPFTPSTSTAIEVTVGHYASGVSMDPMTNQFYTITCGSLTIEEYWGNYLDYNPYTKLTLFLPYVGEITLNPDEVMTRTITIKYRVDAMTGAFVAFILRDDDKILGEYQGNCSLQVPISSANYAQLHSALLGLAGAAVGTAVGAAGSGISGLLSGGTNVLTSAAGMMDSKIRHSHSGALGSASGFMGSQEPYLIIERARQCLPVDLNKFAGYPSQITETLGALSGFTSVSEIVLDGIPLTDEELGELREILKGGVYL